MQRERVADDIYVFTSDLYAQVTAGVVVTSEGAVVIDTLAAQWVVRRFGSRDKYGTKARNREAIEAYMRNWLCQHGGLPPARTK